LAFSPDRKKLAFAGSDPIVRVWDLEAHEQTAEFRGHGKIVRKIVFSEDGQRLFSASDDGTVRCWSLQAAPESIRGVALPAPAFPREVGQFGRWPVSRNARFFAVRGTNRIHRVIDLRTFREVGQAHLPADYQSLALRRDGKLAAAGTQGGTVVIWDTEVDRVSYRFTAHTNSVTAMGFSPDSTHFATAAEGGEVRVWTLGKPLPERSWIVAVAGYRVNDLAFTPDGNALVVHGWGQLHLLNLAPGKPDRSTHSGVVYSLDVSQDGSLVAAGSNEEVGVWELPSLRKVASLRGTLGSFTSAVSFSPDGRRVIAADGEGIIWLWDLVTQREVGRFGPTNPAYAHFQEGGDTIILTRGPRLEGIRAPTWKEITEAEQADVQARQLWLKK